MSYLSSSSWYWKFKGESSKIKYIHFSFSLRRFYWLGIKEENATCYCEFAIILSDAPSFVEVNTFMQKIHHNISYSEYNKGKG